MSVAEENKGSHKACSLKTIKAVGFNNWRGENSMTIASETIQQIDTFITEDLDWSKLVSLEYPATLDRFPMYITNIHTKGREVHGVKSVPIRERLANTLAYIASRIIISAGKIVAHQGDTRIMPEHVAMVFLIVPELINNCAWRGEQPPPRKTAKKVPAKKKAPAKKRKVAETVEIGADDPKDTVSESPAAMKKAKCNPDQCDGDVAE